MHHLETAVGKLRQQQPLVLNLTNVVTMDFVANCLLALGAAPIMTVCEDELEALIAISAAVCINIGTLDRAWVRLAHKALDSAKRHQKPVVLDPVGAGATAIRTQTARAMAPHAAIVRGNASEIMALRAPTGTTRGVESMHTLDDAKAIAAQCALDDNTTVVVSGPVDWITDGTRSLHVKHGSPLMQQVTGMGCAMTAVIAAFQGVVPDPFEASVAGARYFALCGEMAALEHKHPGTFKHALIDQLHAAEFKMMDTLHDQ